MTNLYPQLGQERALSEDSDPQCGQSIFLVSVEFCEGEYCWLGRVSIHIWMGVAVTNLVRRSPGFLGSLLSRSFGFRMSVARCRMLDLSVLFRHPYDSRGRSDGKKPAAAKASAMIRQVLTWRIISSPT